jgi:hypothetical protein
MRKSRREVLRTANRRLGHKVACATGIQHSANRFGNACSPATKWRPARFCAWSCCRLTSGCFVEESLLLLQLRLQVLQRAAESRYRNWERQVQSDQDYTPLMRHSHHSSWQGFDQEREEMAVADLICSQDWESVPVSWWSTLLCEPQTRPPFSGGRSAGPQSARARTHAAGSKCRAW